MCYPAQDKRGEEEYKKCTLYGGDGHFFIFVYLRKNYEKQIEQRMVSVEI